MRRSALLVLLPVVIATALLSAAAPPAAAFSDVPPDLPAYRAIAELQLKHVLDGYPDGTFRPDAPTQRAEFAKMLVRVLFLSVDASATPAFPDLAPAAGLASAPPSSGASPAPSEPSDAFPNSFVDAARDAGLMVGTTAGLADPYAPLSGAQAASMLVRAARSVPGGLAPVPPAFQGKAAGSSDRTHGADIRLAEVNGLLANLDLSSWDPWAPVSRGEAADLVANLVTCFG